MALKFLNKKGWHTGSLRNIENVWKAEQKHDAEQKKLEELRKQIQEERERAEFRELQEQAGLVPRQERLEFLYDSGLAVGKSSGFKALESLPTKSDPPDSTAASSSASKPQSSVPGALFEDKPQSANDAWRKLHSDPLLLIRQREQEALARVKNNPVQMAMIKKSVEAMKLKDKTRDEKDEEKLRKKHHHKKSKFHKKSKRRGSSSDEDSSDGEDHRGKRDGHRDRKKKDMLQTRESDEDSSEGDKRGKHRDRKHKDLKCEGERGDYRRKSKHDGSNYEVSDGQREHGDAREREHRGEFTRRGQQQQQPVHSSSDTAAPKRRRNPVRLSEEERAARLREMQQDAELHEEQRWKRLKKADENDAKEAVSAHSSSGGRNFLDAAHRSIYGAEKGGSTTIEESVRRRTHYLQGRSEATERNAFRR